jgi:TonB-dependent receptor
VASGVIGAALCGAVAFAAACSPSFAQIKQFDIPSEEAGKSLPAFAHQAGVEVIAPGDKLHGLITPEIKGVYEVDIALERLLKGTGLIARRTAEGRIAISPPAKEQTEEREGMSPVLKNSVSTLALIFGIVSAGSASAQDSQVLETVTVTGIRASLHSSQQIKQNSDFMVDAIKSEDIGKYPDNNVAESLQRIPGVAISRSADGGEGQQITVRGMGPQFNTVLWNGRKIASENSSRSFDFDVLPSNLLGGTVVNKSTDVSLQEGAIGATVNMQTLRPLDLDPVQVVLDANANYDVQANVGRPQGFGLVSFHTDNKQFGILLAASYQRRSNQDRFISTASWIPETAMDASYLAPGQTFDPAATYFGPSKYTNDIVKEDRERIGLLGTAQWQPAEGLLVTFDALYNKFNVKTDGIESAWYGNFSTGYVLPKSVYADANNTITEYTYAGTPEYVKITQNRPTETYAYGLNAAWDVNDKWKMTLDASTSRAENADGGKDQYFVIHGPMSSLDTAGNPATGVIETYSDRMGYDTPIAYDGKILGYDPVNYAAGSPQLAGAQPVGTDWDRDNPNGYRSWWTNRQGNTVKDSVKEVRWDNTYKLDWGILDKVQFGAAYSKQTKQFITISASDVGWTNYGAIGIPLSPTLFYQDNATSFMSTVNTPVTGKFLNFNGEALISYLESAPALALRDQINGLPAGTSAASIMPRGYDAKLDPGATWSAGEEVYSGYLNVSAAGEIGSMPFAANAGFRYTHTHQASVGAQNILLDLLPSTDTNAYLKVSSADLQPIIQTSDYYDILPAFNARLNVTDNLVVRGAVSETLTRPDLQSLSPIIVFVDTPRKNGLAASGGNSGLQPYTSWNYDLAVEWYFGTASYLSAALFEKDIDGFVAQQVVPEDFPIANSSHINDEYVHGTTSTWQVTRNVNLGSARIRGVELATQIAFDFLPSYLKYLGVTGSVVIPESNRGFNRASFNNNNAFPGLSNSYYATLYYDDGTYETRLSLSHRNTYFNGMNTSTEPTFVLGASYLDARVAYNLNSQIQVYGNAVNLTDEGYNEVGRYMNRFLDYHQFGRRFEAGVRFKF